VISHIKERKEAMVSYKPVFDEYGALQYIETGLTGHDLLCAPKLNKGFAFSHEERRTFNLLGKLPFNVETLAEQTDRIYKQYLQTGTEIEKNIYLNALYDKNEILFYRVVSDHFKEMLPIIYTPTLEEMVEKSSLQFRRTRGLYLSYPEREEIEQILDNGLSPEIDLIVITDGERVLGLGDQGACAMTVSLSKLMVYCLCGGINPYRLLPIQIDVGTNNQRLLNDPMYYGWHHPRIVGKEYDDFIDLIIHTIHKKFPKIYFHWEDLGYENARRNLERFKDKICTFNDEMQGTGAVTLAALLAAINITKTKLSDHRIVMFGAGPTGVGIADQLYDALMRDGLSPEVSRSHFWLIDKSGLLTDNMEDLLPFQRIYARSHLECNGWQPNSKGKFGLYEVVKYVKPSILIGTSNQGGAFTQGIVELMSSYTERPIIFPLSNPTEQSEAIPIHLLNWTNGKALIATGSPFDAVKYNGNTITISQCNNYSLFPGMGLGVILSKAKRLTKDMIWAAAKTLSDHSPAAQDPSGSILPDLNDLQRVSQHIAYAVAEQARMEGIAQLPEDMDIKQLVEKSFWRPQYVPYRRMS
jgi:malate dehydrogenase (oxaloacetate-decarboxylating)